MKPSQHVTEFRRILKETLGAGNYENLREDIEVVKQRDGYHLKVFGPHPGIVTWYRCEQAVKKMQEQHAIEVKFLPFQPSPNPKKRYNPNNRWHETFVIPAAD